MNKKYPQNLSEMIKEYRNLSDKVNKKEKEELHGMIVSRVREAVYFMPQEFFGMSEEDCAEFLLGFESRIEGIIENYDESKDNFEAFLYPVLEKNIKGFFTKKQKSAKLERSILNTHSAYEYLLNEESNSTEELVVSEAMQHYQNSKDNIAFLRLKAVFIKNPKSHERFYVYFLSYAVLMVPDDILVFCRMFNFDYAETMQILTTVTGENNESNKEELQKAIELRNEYYGKQMFWEAELAKLNFLADHSKDELCLDEINKFKYYFQSKGVSIQRRLRRIPRSVLAKLFGKNDGTIADYMFFCKNLVECCIDPENMPNVSSYSFGVSSKIIDEVFNLEDFSKISEAELPKLNPISHFKMEIALNC